MAQLGKRVETEQHSLRAWATRLSTTEAQLKQAALTSSHALTTARNAQATVNAFESTGVTGKVSGVVSDVATLKSELSGVYDLVEKMLGSGFGNAGAAESPSAVSGEELRAFKLEMYDKLTTLKQRLSGSGPIHIGGRSFEGVDDCMAALKKWNITGFVYEHIFDPVSIISVVRGATVYTEDFNTGAILQLKTKKSPQMLAAAASFESMVPELFSGAKSQQSDVSSGSVLNGIRTPNMWDRGDQETGVKNFIEQGLRKLLPQQAAQAETLFGRTHPDFQSFVDHMRAEAAAGLRELCMEISSLHQNMIYLTYGDKHTTESQEKDVWIFPQILCQVYFAEMDKVRSIARNLNAYDDPLTANGVAMWASIRAIGVHREFKKHDFREHPRIFPKIHTHVTQQNVRSGEFQALSD